jgi:hypothetical protein
MRGLDGVNMDNNHEIQIIESKILSIRGQQVMLDRDLAALYQVTTKRLNEQVKRNIDKFENFFFQLSSDEKNELVANCDRLNTLKHSSSNPFVFTEHGILMLASVLNSKVAIQMNRKIIDTFIFVRKKIQSNPNYDLLKEQILRLQSDTKLISADMVALKADHKIDLNVQNMEINDLNEKVTELLNEFNKFREASIIIKKDDGIGRG